MKKFNELFNEHTGEGIIKWSNYGDIYDKHFAPFREHNINILEIGVLRGGSMRMWEKYFPKANIFGIDINEECLQYQSDRTKIFIGDQSDVSFLRNVKAKIPKIDILIDDGSHKEEHQKKTFEVLSDYMKSNGKYVIEDIETSYYNEFNGGINKKGTFIENLKNLIDVINRDYIKDKKLNTSSPRRGNGNYSFIRNDNKILSMEIYTNCAILNFGYDEELKIVNIHTLSNYEEKLKALIENNRNDKKIQRCCKKIQDKISALHKIMTENEIISALNLMEKCLKLRREIEDVPKYIKKE